MFQYIKNFVVTRIVLSLKPDVIEKTKNRFAFSGQNIAKISKKTLSYIKFFFLLNSVIFQLIVGLRPDSLAFQNVLESSVAFLFFIFLYDCM